METPTLIPVVVHTSTGLCKDPHPKGDKPVKPLKSDFKKEEQFDKALSEYDTKIVEWNEIDSNLKQYQIKEMKCESGLMVNVKVLNYKIGTKLKAQLLETGEIIDDGFKYK